jgi:hypothetical protein
MEKNPLCFGLSTKVGVAKKVMYKIFRKTYNRFAINYRGLVPAPGLFLLEKLPEILSVVRLGAASL